MGWQHWGRGVCCWLLWAAGVGLEVRADDLGHPWPATTSVATAGFLGSHLATLPDGDRYRNEQNTFSPDGELLAVLGSDGHIRVWNWRRKQLLQTLLRSSGNSIGYPDQTLAFSLDGRWLAYCHPSDKDDRNLSVWNTHDWQLQPTEPGSKGDCTGLKFSSDGRELLVLQKAPSRTTNGSRLSVYRSADWQVDWQWGLSDRFFGRQMALSPDGKTLAIAGERYPDLPINWSWPEKHRYQLHFLSLVTRQVLFSIEPMLEMRRGRMVWRPDGQVLAMFGSLYPLGREPPVQPTPMVSTSMLSPLASSSTAITGATPTGLLSRSDTARTANTCCSLMGVCAMAITGRACVFSTPIAWRRCRRFPAMSPRSISPPMAAT